MKQLPVDKRSRTPAGAGKAGGGPVKHLLALGIFAACFGKLTGQLKVRFRTFVAPALAGLSTLCIFSAGTPTESRNAIGQIYKLHNFEHAVLEDHVDMTT